MKRVKLNNERKQSKLSGFLYKRDSEKPKSKTFLVLLMLGIPLFALGVYGVCDSVVTYYYAEYPISESAERRNHFYLPTDTENVTSSSSTRINVNGETLIRFSALNPPNSSKGRMYFISYPSSLRYDRAINYLSVGGLFIYEEVRGDITIRKSRPLSSRSDQYQGLFFVNETCPSSSGSSGTSGGVGTLTSEVIFRIGFSDSETFTADDFIQNGTTGATDNPLLINASLIPASALDENNETYMAFWLPVSAGHPIIIRRWQEDETFSNFNKAVDLVIGSTAGRYWSYNYPQELSQFESETTFEIILPIGARGDDGMRGRDANTTAQPIDINIESPDSQIIGMFITCILLIVLLISCFLIFKFKIKFNTSTKEKTIKSFMRVFTYFVVGDVAVLTLVAFLMNFFSEFDALEFLRMILNSTIFLIVFFYVGIFTALAGIRTVEFFRKDDI